MNYNNCNICTHYDGIVVKHSKHCSKYGEIIYDNPLFNKGKDNDLFVQNVCHEECTWKHNLAIQIMIIIIMILSYKILFH